MILPASLGIPSDIQAAADTVLDSVPHNYDFGMFNGQIFSYVAAAGAFTEVSYGTPQYLKNLLGKYAYYFEASRKITDLSDVFSLKIEIDGETDDRRKFHHGRCVKFKIHRRFPAV